MVAAFLKISIQTGSIDMLKATIVAVGVIAFTGSAIAREIRPSEYATMFLNGVKYYTEKCGYSGVNTSAGNLAIKNAGKAYYDFWTIPHSAVAINPYPDDSCEFIAKELNGLGIQYFGLKENFIR